MLRKTLSVFGLLAVMSSCVPAYAQVNELTEANCKTVKAMSRQVLIDLQQGATQFQIMKALNDRDLKDFGKDGESVKLYLQVNTSAFTLNLKRGYRIQKIMQVVEEDCRARIGKAL